MKDKALYSIVIPVYNSTGTLSMLADGIGEVFQNVIEEDYEIIFVDDRSPNEKTWPLLLELQKSDQKVKIIRLAYNSGQHAATLCGMQHSSGNYVITMDDDMQHLPEEIPMLITLKDNDVIIAGFEKKKDHGLFKVMASRVKNYLEMKVSCRPKDISMSSFILYRREIVDRILQYRSNYPILGTYIFRVTENVVNAKVEHAPRQEGQSGYTISRMVKLFTNMLINNAPYLLKITGIMSVMFSVAGFAGIAGLLSSSGGKDTGWWQWLFFASGLLLLAGLTLLVLRIAGGVWFKTISQEPEKELYSIDEILPKSGSK